MIKSSIWSTCCCSLLHFLHTHTHTLSTQNADKISTGQFMYVRFNGTKNVHSLLMLFLSTNGKKVPQTTSSRCWKNFQKCSISLCVWNCSICSTPVMSYATLTLKHNHSLTNVNIRSRTFSQITCAHTHTLTRNCINMCNVWSDLILFSFLFCRFCIAIVGCCCGCCSASILRYCWMQFYYSLNSFSLSLRFDAVFCFFPYMQLNFRSGFL